jgi:hypothetical protein
MTVSTSARIALAGLVVAASALGFAAQANADCDPMSRSMTPHQPSQCDAPPPPDDVMGPDAANGPFVPPPGDAVPPPAPEQLP